MTKALAHEILSLWKAGARQYPLETITLALWVTGDLDDHTC